MSVLRNGHVAVSILASRAIMLGLPLWEVVIQSTLLCRNTGALKPSVKEGEPIMGSDHAMTFNGAPAWGVHSIYTRYDYNRGGEKLKTITSIYILLKKI